MFILIIFGVCSIAAGVVSIYAYRQKVYPIAIVMTVLCLALTACIFSIYSARGTISEASAVVSEAPVVTNTGEVLVNALALPGGGHYSGLHCATAISRELCASLTVGTLVTIQSTVDEYGVSVSSEIVGMDS